MPKVPASWLARFGRTARAGATAIRPAVPFVLGTGAVTLGTGYVIREATRFREAENPPLQTTALDPDPTRSGDEAQIAFDRRTGRLLVFGSPPSDKVGPERSQEREIQTGIIVAGLVAASVIVFLVMRRGK